MTEEDGWLLSRYSPKDVRDCLDLARRAAGESEAAAESFHDWQCRRSPAGAAIASLAREPSTGRLIGRAVTIPMRVRVSGRVRLAGLSLDPLTDPASQNRGLVADLLGDVCAQTTKENVAFTYGFPSQPFYSTLVNRAEFKNVGSVPLLFMPLNPDRLAMKTMHSRAAAKMASVARRVWRTPPPVPRQEALPGLEIGEIDSFDSSFAAFWDRVQHRFPVMVVRDPTYLNWRFVDVPMREYKAFAARSEGEIRGFIVLRAAPLGQFSAGLIVDLLVEASAEGRAAGRLLIDQAYSYFGERDVDILASLALRHTDEFRLLRSRGFWVSPKFLEPRPFRLVVRCHDEERSPSRLAYELKNWFVTLGDCDVG
jgi:ribosomal protein S18 acetylase RimI-like enzyme